MKFIYRLLLHAQQTARRSSRWARELRDAFRAKAFRRTTRCSGRSARPITDHKGNTIFEQKDVEVPVDWSMTATNIVASKYLHGQIGTPERETGVRQLVGAGGGDGARLGNGGRLLCDAGRMRRLSMTSWPPAADAEGGVQLAGVVQRGLRPAGAEFGRRRTGTGTRRRAA